MMAMSLPSRSDERELGTSEESASMRSIFRGAALASAACAIALLVAGCPPPMPPTVDMAKAPEIRQIPEPVRPQIINGARGGDTVYAHRLFPVHDRYYHLRSSGSIGEYNAEVRRGVMRLAYGEFENEVLGSYGGWDKFYNTAFAKHYQDLNERETPSPYKAHFWWDESRRGYHSGGVTPSTMESAFRSGWRSEYRGGLPGGTGGGGGGGGGLPGGAGGGGTGSSSGGAPGGGSVGVGSASGTAPGA
jgi:hypothetical protein